MKKVLISLLILVVVVAGIIYYYRYDIFTMSAESIIRKNLPSYVTLDEIKFDLAGGKVSVNGLGIKNPFGYNNKYLATIGSITCRYEMRGKTILDGIAITDITAKAAIINIERRADAKINVNQMGDVLNTSTPQKKSLKTEAETGKSPVNVDIASLVKLPDTINLKNGKVIFSDSYGFRQPYRLSFENVDATLVLKLSSDYKTVLDVQSQGSGLVGGDPAQKLNWVISLNPTISALTMGNTFHLRDIEITPFAPYYDTYSPISIQKGRVSGTLIINFDHGNIGSQSTLYLSGLVFSVKEGAAGAQYWQAAIPEVIRYLQSSPGEITFDFKIKGSMQNPQFYPGPHVKAAIQNMVVDKVSDAIDSFTKDKSEADSGTGSGKSDAEKVADIVKGLLNR